MSEQNIMQNLLSEVEHRSLLLRKSIIHRLNRLSDNKKTIFVAGAQRSGTNMMMDVLERSYETDVYHESDKRAFREYELRSLDTIHDIVNSSRANNVVIKVICDLQLVRQLLNDFEPSRAVWIVRNYEDTVNSHIVKWNRMPDMIRTIVENDRNSAGWRGRGMSDETYEILKQVYHSGMSNASACALFWYFRNILFFEQGLEHDRNVIHVAYEDLVQEPVPQFKRLFDFLELSYTPRVNSKIFADSIRKRQPPDIEGSVRSLCDGLTERFYSLKYKA